jgi:enoyl-CoA hydratase/carnithine racemase
MQGVLQPDISFAGGKVLKSSADGTGVITFNSPYKRNAMSLEIWEGFGHALTELRDDDAVRVVILRGAGGKAFGRRGYRGVRLRYRS